MFDRPTTNNDDNRGAILLIALLVVSAITAVGLGMSVVIFNGLRSAAIVDQSISATYASEAGLEWTLEQLAEGREAGTDLDTVILAIQANPVVALVNGATWRTDQSEAKVDNLLQDIAKDQTIELDLFDPADTINPLLNIKKLRISTLTNSGGWAEIDWVAWDGTSFIENSRTVQIGPSDLVSGVDVDLSIIAPGLDLDPSVAGIKAYRVKVRARFGDLNDVVIQALDNGTPPNVISIPNRALVKSEGKSGNATIVLTTGIPWRIPTSPLFDFVIFSEESLEK